MIEFTIFFLFEWRTNSVKFFLMAGLVMGAVCFGDERLAGQQPPTGPRIYLQDPTALSVSYTGPSSATSALTSNQAVPLSLAAGDFYQDGFSSLAVGYSAPSGGVLTLCRGNLDAFAPQSAQSWQAIAQGQYPSPFLSTAAVYPTAAAPDFLAVGEFAGSDHTDLVMASRAGSSLYVFAGDGHGNLAPPQVIGLPGPVTALASGTFGSPSRFTSLLVAVSASSSALLLYQGSAQGLSLKATFALPATATAVALADLDGDSLPDAAIVAGGQVLILHAAQGSAQPTLEQLSLPVSASTIALGYFVHDRGWRQQMAILASDGSVNIVVHTGFDPREWTQAELQAMRQAILQKNPNPYAPPPFTAVNDGWKILETFPGVAPIADPSHPPLMYRASIFDQSTHDVMIINGQAAQMAFISHPNPPPGSTTLVPGQLSTRAYSSGYAVAGLPMRVNVDGRPGMVVAHQGTVAVSVMMPVPDPTFTVNTPNDTVDANPGDGICADSQGLCSLRAAVMEANALKGNDTIMLPPGTYALTIPGNGGNDATAGHLAISDGITIVGQGPGSPTIVGQAGDPTVKPVDKIFTIGLSPTFVSLPDFNTSFSNLILQSGQAPATDPSGGAFDWDAGSNGTGTLTLTNVTISGNVANSTLTGQDDGGGVFLSSEGSGATSVTITGSTFQNNLAVDAGGGLAMIGPISLTMKNSQLSNNRAVGGGAQNGGGLASFFSGTAAGSATLHGATLTGNTAGNSTAGNGGGIWSQQPLTVDRSSVLGGPSVGQGNTSGNLGGGIWSDVTNGAVSVTTTTLTGNQANGDGGAIHVEGSGNNPFNMIYSRISGNHAPTGSGLHSTTAANATVTDNWWGCNEGPAPVSGTTSVKVFNSGVLASGGQAADGSTDIHYSLVGSADPTALGPGTVLANSNAPPIPPWLTPNGPNSKWIAPLANADAGLNPGTYVYQTTFDLTGLDPTSVALKGQWAADNSGSIDLNGVSIANSSASGFTAFSPFTISSGFINGINTLDFVLTNSGVTPNPTGFRAEVSGSGNSRSACDLVAGTATANPWITLTHKPSSSPVTTGSSTQLTASFLQDSAGGAIDKSNLGVLIGLPIIFANAVNGSLANPQGTIQPSGTATATLATTGNTATPSLLARADATVDNATASAVVAVSDFALSALPATQPINVGGIAPAVKYDVAVSSIEGFNGAVALSCTAGTGIQVVCNPNTINSPGAATMSVSISGSVGAPATGQLFVLATSGGIQHSASVQLTVADFQIAVSAPDGTSNVTVQHGQTAIYTVTCSSSTGFSGPVQLSTSIPGANISFGQNPLNCPGQSPLTVIPNTTPIGANQFNVTGTFGSASRSGPATLKVITTDFTISVSPASQLVDPRGFGTGVTVTITDLGDPTPVNLSVTGLSGRSATLDATTITGSGSTGIGVAYDSSDANLGFDFLVTGTNGNFTHSASFTVNVDSLPPCFIPCTIMVRPGANSKQ